MTEQSPWEQTPPSVLPGPLRRLVLAHYSEHLAASPAPQLSSRTQAQKPRHTDRTQLASNDRHKRTTMTHSSKGQKLSLSSVT